MRSRSSAARDEALLAANTVSAEAVETSATALLAAQADVAAAKAAVQTANINLDYTRVTAPVAGRIGRSSVTEGAYVQQSAATLMATISSLTAYMSTLPSPRPSRRDCAASWPPSDSPG